MGWFREFLDAGAYILYGVDTKKARQKKMQRRGDLRITNIVFNEDSENNTVCYWSIVNRLWYKHCSLECYFTNTKNGLGPIYRDGFRCARDCGGGYSSNGR